METRLLDYDLPEELIAQYPIEPRDEARMLVLDRAGQTMHADVFRNLPLYLRRGDCVVLNDTRVIPARLHARKPSGGHVEIFLLREWKPGRWEALVRPSARVRSGMSLEVAPGIRVVTGDRLDAERRLVQFVPRDVSGILEAVGEAPLPPYIARAHPDSRDLERYQTVYARVPGAVAAPTAGLHFTARVLEALDAAGIQRAFLTLHVGYGTFRPIRAAVLEEHSVAPEWFEMPEATADLLNRTRRSGGRIVSVGTTTTRVLETQHVGGTFRSGTGETGLYIFPPYDFSAVDVLQTNFHLPRSSLLALVCAFGGIEFVLEAYRFAVKERFRFYSYGDVMLIV